MDGWLSVATVAEKLGITTAAVHRLCWRGTLAFRFVAGRRVIHKDTIANYLENPKLQARRRAKHTPDGNGQLRLDISANGIAEVRK